MRDKILSARKRQHFKAVARPRRFRHRRANRDSS